MADEISAAGLQLSNSIRERIAAALEMLKTQLQAGCPEADFKGLVLVSTYVYKDPTDNQLIKGAHVCHAKDLQGIDNDDIAGLFGNEENLEEDQDADVVGEGDPGDEADG
jgi:hypothetical protein